MNSNMHKIQIASALFEQVDTLEHCTMVGMLFHKEIPEAYTFIERQIIYNNNIDIYKLNNTYVVNIRHVGLFQCI